MWLYLPIAQWTESELAELRAILGDGPFEAAMAKGAQAAEWGFAALVNPS